MFPKIVLPKNFLDKNKTQKTCDKAVDSYLLAFKFVSDWFVMSDMVK